MDKVPASAACNEAVKLAQKKGFYSLKNFVNGVLRSVTRGIDSVEYPNPANVMEYLSVKYSMPRWIVKKWVDEFGQETTEKMLGDFLKARPMTVRFKTNRIDPQTIIDSLNRQGVTVKAAPYLPYAYEINNYNHLQALEAFQKGWIYVQDVSSMLVTEVAAPDPGDYVVDLCAAPGGKSMHVADKMGDLGIVEARDLTANKVALLEENIHRLNLINVNAIQADATIYDSGLETKADIVLADVPCSGLGVIGKKPDIKYNLTSIQQEELVILQRKILHNAAAYVKPGGTLIYSTCTVSAKENQNNVNWFVANYPFVLEDLDPYLPEELHTKTTKDGYLQLIPGVHKTDGFFLARMRKEK